KKDSDTENTGNYHDPKCFRLQEITIHVFAGGHTIFPYDLVQNDSSLPKSFFSNHDFPIYFGPMQSYSLWPIVSFPTTQTTPGGL
uniref:Uncharacterized protein n=1 Tax=Rhinopithecus bieti TaxID=61621 RepID=A0A2K6KNA3_RHIBE